MQHDNEVISLTAQQLLDEGLHCYNEKNLQGALYYLESLFSLDKNNEDLLHTIITMLQEFKSYNKAESYIESLVILDPENENYQFIQAENLFYLQSYVKAIPLYLKLHRLHPLNTHILQRLLDIYTKQNKRSEVKQVQVLLKKAEISTSDSQAEIEETVKVALSLVEQDMNEEAKVLLESVLLFDNENVNVNGIYGALLSDDNDYEQALYYLDKVALQSSSSYIVTYLKCLKKVRGSASVIKYLETRTKKYPQEHKTKNMLGFYYFNNEQYRQAYQVYKSIKQYYHDDLQFLKFSAMSRFMAINEDKKWLNQDKLAAAAKELHAIYNRLPEDEHILISLINYYVNIGEIKKAYEMSCTGFFSNENVKEWSKLLYFNATRNRKSFFKSYLAGRVARSLLVDIKDIEHKLWTGESLVNKKVVILREQGIGDEILFASNYGWIIQQALRVDIFCSKRLKLEFERLYPNAYFHTLYENGSIFHLPQEKDDYILSADTVVLAGDLPAIHYEKFGLPLYNECYYSITQEKKLFWENKLLNSVNTNKPKIGIIWRSGSIDSARSAYYLKNSEVAYIISKIPEAEFINCMYVECNKEVSDINKITKRKIHNISDLDQKNDFENTAAMFSCLDLLVGAYTATVSLALAVGTPVVAYSSDYIKEDGIIEKAGINYSNLSHISFPVFDKKIRADAIEMIIKKIKQKLKILLVS